MWSWFKFFFSLCLLWCECNRAPRRDSVPRIVHRSTIHRRFKSNTLNNSASRRAEETHVFLAVVFVIFLAAVEELTSWRRGGKHRRSMNLAFKTGRRASWKCHSFVAWFGSKPVRRRILDDRVCIFIDYAVTFRVMFYSLHTIFFFLREFDRPVRW